MATHSDKSPVTRETSAYVRSKGLRALMVTVSGGLLIMRPKGMRQEEALDLASIYNYAIRSRVMREQAEKKAKRKARRSK